jgi:inner membrane protein
MRGSVHAACGIGVMIYLNVTHLEDVVLLNQSANVMTMSMAPMVSTFTAMIGSYMPDIDIENSKMGRKAGFLSKMLTHRGITHTLLVPVLLALLIRYMLTFPPLLLPTVAVLGFGIGWLIHIVADMFNSKGVPILWPLTKSHIHIAAFKTGTWHEFVFIVLWCGGLVACYLLL